MSAADLYSAETDDGAYTSGNIVLHPEHLAQLKASAIAPKIARDRGYQTVTSKQRLELLNFSPAQCRPPGVLIPLHDVHGRPSIHQFRSDRPRINNKGKPIKYETPLGTKMALDCPPACFPFLADPNIPLLVTEGVKKADAAASQGLCCVAVLGVWAWRGSNTLDGLAALTDWEAVPLKERTVYIVFDSDVAQKPKVQKGLARLAQYLTSMGAIVHVVNLQPGPNGEKTGLDDYFARGGNVAELLGSTTSSADFAALVAADRKESQADLLVKLARKHAVLFHDPDQEAYATINAGTHYETVRLSSKHFRQWLAAAYFDQKEKAPSSEAISAAINTLSGLAIFKGEEHRTYVRIAGHEGNIYLDLADAGWRVVEITPTGWRVITNDACPMKFIRSRGMEALPVPQRGGSVEELRPFINARHDDDDADFILTIGWLVAALRPSGPYPIDVHNGEQGSTKSTRGRVMRRLVDPNKSDLRKEPKDTDDLLIAAKHGWVCAFDNMSSIQSWLSDSLCRLSTGGGIGKRGLYTDDEEIIIDARRPAFLNGITQLVVKGDLTDRALIHELPNVEKKDRREEEVFWAEFEKARPRILGALLDAVVAAARNKDAVRAELKEKERMADFMVWVAAAEYALPWKRGKFVEVYRANRSGANQTVLEASLVGEPIRDMVDQQPGRTWKGTAGELLKGLNTLRGDEKPPKEWPGSPRALSGMLRRIAPNLRETGMTVELPPPKDKTRTYNLGYPPPSQEIAAQPPKPPNRPTEQKALEFPADSDGDTVGGPKNQPPERPDQPPSQVGDSVGGRSDRPVQPPERPPTDFGEKAQQRQDLSGDGGRLGDVGDRAAISVDRRDQEKVQSGYGPNGCGAVTDEKGENPGQGDMSVDELEIERIARIDRERNERDRRLGRGYDNARK